MNSSTQPFAGIRVRYASTPKMEFRHRLLYPANTFFATAAAPAWLYIEILGVP